MKFRLRVITQLQYYQLTVYCFQVKFIVVIDPINMTASISLRAVYDFTRVYMLQSWFVALVLVCRPRG
jgi:type III secretory pathway component EscS